MRCNQEVIQFEDISFNSTWQILNAIFISNVNYIEITDFWNIKSYVLFHGLIICFLLLRTCVWLDSDLEGEALREESLPLSEICSWQFSLASFILLAKNLAYSAGFLFFLVYGLDFGGYVEEHVEQQGAESLVLGFISFLV